MTEVVKVVLLFCFAFFVSLRLRGSIFGLPMRRVLHVVQRYAPYEGGSENYVRELSERFAAAGDAVTMLTTDAWDLEYFWDARARTVEAPAEETLSGVRVLRFPVRHWPLPQPPALSSFTYRATRRLMAEGSRVPLPPVRDRLLYAAGHLAPLVPGMHRWLRRHGGDFDLVHAANISLEGTVYAAAATARRARAPLVVTPFVHLGVPGDNRVVRYYTMPHQIRLLSDAAAVVTQTPQETDFLAAKGVPREKMRQIGVGVHPESVTGGNAARARVAYNLRGAVVYANGTAAADKGTYDLLHAMQLLWREGREATLVHTGPMLSAARAFFAALPAEDAARVRLLGFVEKREQADVLAAADVLTLPSRTDSFGIAFLDAWANGVPVIGANAGGIPGVVSDEIDGLLVPFGDPEALAVALRRLLDDPALRQRLGEAGRAKVHARYTWERIVSQVDALYADLLRP